MMHAHNQARGYVHEDPETWPLFRPLIIAHDVGRSRDRSTAVVGGNSPVPPRLLGSLICASSRRGCVAAHAPARSPRSIANIATNALIVADLSNDPSYADALYETFGRRVIGLHITRSGDGMQAEQRPVGRGSILVYTVGRSYLLEAFQAELQAGLVKMLDGPMTRRAFQQLAELETELRESGACLHVPGGQA